jgi:hypothetical protein
MYLGALFVKANYAMIKGEDKTSGTVNYTISDSTAGLGGGIGYAFSISNYVKLEICADFQNSNFKASPSGFTSQSQYLRFGGTVGLGILIPSTPPRRSYFKTKLSPSQN